AARLAADGIAVRSVVVPPPPPAATPPSTAIDALSAPSEARGPFAVRVAARAAVASAVVLSVDGVERERSPLAPPRGELLFDGVRLEPGSHEVAVTVVG